MMSLRLPALIFALAMTGGALAACGSTWVVVPPPDGGYTAVDTLRGYLDGDEVRVVFRFDTITSTRVVTRTDTLFTEGTDTVFRVEELLRVDTVTVTTTDTLRLRNTFVRHDTVRVAVTDTVLRVDTVRMTIPDTVRVAVTDTLIRVDTILRTDTILHTDTVTVPGRRLLFIPPGHEPPDGQCRVWVHGLPPGRQARAAPCDELGDIPSGAFILFGGDAWDFDYDWFAAIARGEEPPPQEILALRRRGRNR